MNNEPKNGSVRCSVKECTFHGSESDCTLSTIQVGSHEAFPTKQECTDCQSFQLKSSR